jgi:hypothetical protein
MDVGAATWHRVDSLGGSPALQLLGALASRAASDSGNEHDSDVHALLRAMACPPFDRLRPTAAPADFSVEEEPYQRWRYEMRMVAAELTSVGPDSALRVRFFHMPVQCSRRQ